MTPPLFTILLPIVRPPCYLAATVATVLAQTIQDFELIVVCDGAPAATVEAAQALSREDRRVQVLARPKGERHGELHRHEALMQASGSLVGHLDDDALWFPDHLATLSGALQRADFGHTTQARILEDGTLLFVPGDLGEPSQRELMATTAHNWFGLTNAGYRMSAYRALPVGWTPAPPEIWSDLWMWRRFIACDLRFASSLRITSLLLHRQKNDATESAVAQHAGLSARITRPGSTLQADVEAAFHARLWDLAREGRPLASVVHPPLPAWS